MTIATTTHLNFRGTAHQALDFYQSVFGGEVTRATYADFGMPAGVPGADKIVFGQVENADGFRLMAYDIPGADDADATAGTTSRRTGRPSPTARSSSRCAPIRSTSSPDTGTPSPTAPRSSSRWPHRRGHPDSAC